MIVTNSILILIFYWSVKSKLNSVVYYILIPAKNKRDLRYARASI